MGVSEWRGELRNNRMERRQTDEKGYQSNPDALEELGQST